MAERLSSFLLAYSAVLLLLVGYVLWLTIRVQRLEKVRRSGEKTGSISD